PQFHTPDKIDGILGASVFAEIIGSNTVAKAVDTPTAVQTSFGYVMTGHVNRIHFKTEQIYCNFSAVDSNLDELGDFPSSPLNNDDEICKNIFLQNLKRGENGQYIGAPPFKDDPSKLGDPFSFATSRLSSLERKFQKMTIFRSLKSDLSSWMRTLWRYEDYFGTHLEDQFYSKINVKPTKRNMLSLLARMLDPNGGISPITSSHELLIKRLWQLHVDWDQAPPPEIETE
ncbi:hypothetical protein JTB14_003672, partial [Gonioctena quinquepunctata]